MTNLDESDKGERLRLIIMHTNLSQKKFAEKIGIQHGYLSSIVNGHKEISGSVIEAIAIHYGHIYNIGWLLSGNGEMLLNNNRSDQVSEPTNTAYAKATRLDRLEKDIAQIKQHLGI